MQSRNRLTVTRVGKCLFARFFTVRRTRFHLGFVYAEAGVRAHQETCRTFLCESPTTQSPVLGASMPHVPFLGARKIVLSTCVHGLRAYHALNQYRIRYEDMRCKSLVLAPLRLFGL